MELPCTAHALFSILLVLIGATFFFCTLALYFLACLIDDQRDLVPVIPISGGLLPGELASLPPTFAYSGGRTGSTVCAVCLNLFAEDQRVRGLPGCNHFFHAGCIDEWLRRSATCPICRSPVVRPQTSTYRIPAAEQELLGHKTLLFSRPPDVVWRHGGRQERSEKADAGRVEEQSQEARNGLHTCPPHSQAGKGIAALESGGLLERNLRIKCDFNFGGANGSRVSPFEAYLEDGNLMIAGVTCRALGCYATRSIGPLEWESRRFCVSNSTLFLPYKEVEGRRWGSRLLLPKIPLILHSSSSSSSSRPSSSVICLPASPSTGKVVATAVASQTVLEEPRRTRYRFLEGLRERYLIGEEYDIVLAMEEDSDMLQNPGCIAMSLDLLEAGFWLPLPAVRDIEPTTDLFRGHFSLAASP
ncbi:hypothetical protein Taro_046173 [Colocasia esculenta]|uniref:RING-type E3 ubiquitin transferase n=1 Tax=Colocasia esculenta TaxID=4460 RepID=A0A843X762_COLES|nr:hypothetical protein [Colocasia esculenta]